MKRPAFVINEIYHIYNRGVDKRNIFLDDHDRFRFIHDLYEFNDEQPAQNIYYRNIYEVSPRKIEQPRRKLLVEMLAFCLMNNHFHFLLRQKRENGISKFMRKLGTGYTIYFNQKYERSGALFQGLFKAVLVKEESQLLHLPYYIHFNPLDFIVPRWRDGEIKDINKAIKFLETYRWSSYLDYIGINNFPSVTHRDFLLKFFDGVTVYKQETIYWLKSMNLERVKDLLLE